MPAPSMLTSTAGLATDTVKTVFNQAALAAFRANFVFRRLADVKWAGGPGAQPMPGNAVTFTIVTALTAATSAIAEDTEPSPVAIGDTQKTVTLVEQGNAIKSTMKLRKTTFLDWDLVVPREVAANMEESLDIVARDILVAGTNVYYAGAATSRVTVSSTMNLSAAGVRRMRSKLAGFNTPPPANSNMYIGIVHPDSTFDLQQETGNQAWNAPHDYSAPEQIWTGEIGSFSGVRFIENANSKNFVDSGVGGTVDVYAAIFVGLQALGEGVGVPQHMVISGPFDDLQRFISVGWYALIGYGRIRENSLVRFEHSSSIGAN